MLDLKPQTIALMTKANITEADILKYERGETEQAKEIDIAEATLSSIKDYFEGLPSTAKITDMSDWSYSSEPDFKIVWMAPETDDEYARRVIKDIKQKQGIKKAKATKESKERAELERLKKKYGQ